MRKALSMIIVATLLHGLCAKEYVARDGTVYTGESVSFRPATVVIKKADGKETIVEADKFRLEDIAKISPTNSVYARWDASQKELEKDLDKLGDMIKSMEDIATSGSEFAIKNARENFNLIVALNCHIDWLEEMRAQEDKRVSLLSNFASDFVDFLKESKDDVKQSFYTKAGKKLIAVIEKETELMKVETEKYKDSRAKRPE